MNSTLENLCSDFKKFYNSDARVRRENEKAEGFFYVVIIFGGLFVVMCIVACIGAIMETFQIRESRKKSRITHQPRIPYSPTKIRKSKGYYQGRDNLIPEARIYLEEDPFSVWKLLGFRRSAIDKVDEFMKTTYGLENNKIGNFGIVPEKTRIVSVKADGFKHGKEPHEFKKIGQEAPNSYYCWQMFGNNRIQATYFIEDRKRYMAGFCIYIDDPWAAGTRFPSWVVKEFSEFVKKPATQNPAPAPEVVEPVPEDLNIRFCKKLQRNVMSGAVNGVVIHQEWNLVLKKMKNEKCEECTKEDDPPAYATLQIE